MSAYAINRITSSCLSAEASIRTDGLKEETEKFLVSQQTTMPTWYDVDGSTEARIFAATGDQRAIPLTVLLDKTGKIRGVWRGFVRGDDVEMERLIRAALEDKTA